MSRTQSDTLSWHLLPTFQWFVTSLSVNQWHAVHFLQYEKYNKDEKAIHDRMQSLANIVNSVRKSFAFIGASFVRLLALRAA